MARWKKTSPGATWPDGAYGPRAPGRLITYWNHGQYVTQAWPRKRKKLSPVTIEQNNDMRNLAAMIKAMAPWEMAAARQIAENSKYVWRDVLSKALVGRLVEYPNYGAIVSQYNLDILGTDPGMIIIRAADKWIALPPGLADQVLQMIDGLPSWQDVASGSGIDELTGDVTAGPASGTAAATLAATGVTPGTYASADIAIDAKGRVTSAADGNGATAIETLIGDITAGPGPGAATATLASSGATAGTYSYPTMTVDAKGRVTSISGNSPSSFAPIFHPGIVAGNFYTRPMAGAVTNISTPANTIYAAPFFTPDAITIATATARVGTGVSGGRISIAWYQNSGGKPGARIANLGELACDTNGNKTLSSLSTVIPAGFSWVATNQNMTIIMQCASASDVFNQTLMGVSAISASPTIITCYTGSQTYSASNLPDPFPSPTPDNKSIPQVYITI